MPSVPEWMCTRCLGVFSICRVNTQNNYAYHRYCPICNRKFGSPISTAKIKTYGIDIATIPVFQPNKTRGQKAAAKSRSEAARTLRKQKIPVTPITLEQQKLMDMPYAEYLKTCHWSDTRNAALKRAHYRCQVCNSADELHVHHRTYERRGHEKPEDLTVLCSVCHAKFHNKLP